MKATKPKPTLDTIYVHSDLQKLLGVLEPRSAVELRELIEAQGFLDTIKVWWDGKAWYVLDGHNRLEIWNSLPADTRIRAPRLEEVCRGGDLGDAMAWMRKHQAGRRNWSDRELSYHRGLLYNSALGRGDNVAQALAEEDGVSDRKVKADGRFARAIERIQEMLGEEFAKDVVGSALSKARICELAQGATAAEIKQAYNAARQPQPNGPRGWDDGLIEHSLGRITKLVGERTEHCRAGNRSKRFRELQRALDEVFRLWREWQESEPVS